ncbi:unnamed protein product [Nyctereutes procyonoides]|uniref:(raccoon dog) hypothetical protein n=1 Tax=Nyctereutes procyonoides TaxID=34880 RepID=A0A811XV03_NYCPR|nr:unnamed protein product [Nyctereutes procyonoides]
MACSAWTVLRPMPAGSVRPPWHRSWGGSRTGGRSARVDARQARPPPSDCAQLCGPAWWPHVVLGDRRPAGPRRPRPAALWGRGASVTFPPHLAEEQPPTSALRALRALRAVALQERVGGGGRASRCPPMADGGGLRQAALSALCALRPRRRSQPVVPARSPAHPSPKSRCYLAQRTDGRTDGRTAARAAGAARGLCGGTMQPNCRGLSAEGRWAPRTGCKV